ncbi:MAG: NAD(P)/FAD-dependent oxidoreductase [Acidobacteria bacterium]|nr:MAG: NAD(P)/FAD-dependent oxidoreductase [Acidobacteriota bacterium]GIK77758.1 MAG: dihydrolipoamide dehydrogenase [Actinomycetes bacterium]
MSSRYEAVVIGSGPAGETAAAKLAKEDLSVALIERELVGGECAYWACIPSKTLLRPPEARAEAARVAGISEPEARWQEIVAYRNYMVRDLDDSGVVDGYEKRGMTVIKGSARIVDAGRVAVGDQEIEAERIVIATGSEPQLPPVDGLGSIDYWTNREATTLDRVPEDVIVLGGGPVGIELGQMLRRYGAGVTIVEAAERLIDREDPRVGELIAEALADDGIELRLVARATAARADGDRQVLELEGGEELSAERIVVATGRRPRTGELGLERLGIELGERGEIPVDERCRAAERVWAIGDVTGVSMFTHTGTYQARIACADIAGSDARADYRAIPRVVFSDPEIAAVGLTMEEASERGIDAVEGRSDLSRVARAATFGEGVGGEVGVMADRDTRTLVGAWAVGPLAGEWIHQAVLAVKAEIPVEVLRDTVAQFPTFSEAFRPALEDLEL